MIRICVKTLKKVSLINILLNILHFAHIPTGLIPLEEYSGTNTQSKYNQVGCALKRQKRLTQCEYC